MAIITIQAPSVSTYSSVNPMGCPGSFYDLTAGKIYLLYIVSIINL